MKDKIEKILKLDNHFKTVNSFVDDDGTNHLPLIKKELLDLFESELHILKEKARAEERKRCLEVLKDEELKEYLRNPIHASVRNKLDQAISAINNQTNQ